ncbi:MAG TPA: TfoX/Sxy family protein [Polyangiaceae bacterium]|nr:TfoX/Sxy family protein [Polyangiaceae bacterium]
MKLTKPSPGLIAEFRAVLEQLPRAEPRKMFGYDAAFVNGNMAVGLWQNTCVVKLSEDDQAKLLERRLATPFAPMKGRVMSGWLELSEQLAHDPEELLAWSSRAVDYAARLPPKLKKTSKKVAGRKPTAKQPAKKKAPRKTSGRSSKR